MTRCIKIIGTTLPLGQIIAIRGVLSVLVVAVICAHQGVLGSALSLFTPKVLARSLLDVAGTFMFLIALTHMPHRQSHRHFAKRAAGGGSGVGDFSQGESGIAAHRRHSRGLRGRVADCAANALHLHHL